MSKEEYLSFDDKAEFHQLSNQEVFIQTDKSTYLWSNPNLGGDNIIRPYGKSLSHLIDSTDHNYVQYIGSHLIKDYCGSNVQLGCNVHCDHQH